MTGYKYKDEPVVPMTAIDSDTLLLAIRSRRTIRHFTAQAVEDDIIRKILEAGRYSPTGGNSQNVSFTILGSKQAEAEAICVGIFRRGQKIGAPFLDFLKRINITDNFFFKACAGFSGKLRKLLALPKGHKVVTCMVIGYPAVKYLRIVPRKKLKARKL